MPTLDLLDVGTVLGLLLPSPLMGRRQPQRPVLPAIFAALL